jgi:uncharacterized protein YndB with AHSA1/START domain
MDRSHNVHGISSRTIDVARTIDAPAEVVWDLLVDTRYWPEWGPSVTDADCRDRRIRAGSTGQIQLIGGVWIPFEVTSIDAYRWLWEIAGIPATGHRVEPHNGSCRAVFEVPLLAAGYAPVCRLALSRIARLAE